MPHAADGARVTSMSASRDETMATTAAAAEDKRARRSAVSTDTETHNAVTTAFQGRGPKLLSTGSETCHIFFS